MKLSTAGAVLATLAVSSPLDFTFDATNIWVTNGPYGTVTQIKATTAQIVKTVNTGACIRTR